MITAAAFIASARVRVRRRLAIVSASAADEIGAVLESEPKPEPDVAVRSSSGLSSSGLSSSGSSSASTLPTDATCQSVGARSRSDASSGDVRILVAFGDAYDVFSSPRTANPANPSRDLAPRDPTPSPSSSPPVRLRMNADAPTRSAVFLGVVGSSRTNATARSAARPSFLARLANPDDDRNDRRDRSGRSGSGSESGCVSSPRCVPFCRFPFPPPVPPPFPPPVPRFFFFDSRRSGSGVSVPRSTKASRDTPAATAEAIAR